MPIHTCTKPDPMRRAEKQRVGTKNKQRFVVGTAERKRWQQYGIKSKSKTTVKCVVDVLWTVLTSTKKKTIIVSACVSGVHQYLERSRRRSASDDWAHGLRMYCMRYFRLPLDETNHSIYRILMHTNVFTVEWCLFRSQLVYENICERENIWYFHCRFQITNDQSVPDYF